jgi:hypothetical protein
MTEHDYEAVPGLPGRLPPGETLLWQGHPRWSRLMIDTLHIRPLIAYFSALALWGAATGGGLRDVLVTMGACAILCAMLGLFAFGVARTTIYSLTDKRIVLRVGVAVSKCVNLPLSLVGSADLKLNGDGTGNIALRLTQPMPLGYAALWPHVRPWRFARPEPLLRGVPEGQKVAAMLARACGARLAAVAPTTQNRALAA